MKLVYQYVAIFFNFSLASNHFHPLQVENCDSNSRLVVDEDDYGKLRLERGKSPLSACKLDNLISDVYSMSYVFSYLE